MIEVNSVKKKAIAIIMVVVMFCGIGFNMPIQTVHAAMGRAIIQSGTVKTADGSLLRAASIHISKTYSAVQRDWLMDINNIRALRDVGHINTIRLCMLDPREVKNGEANLAYPNISDTDIYADSVVNSCESLGMYVILNYHCQGWIYDNSEWDIRKFWDHFAPRYKNNTNVIYELVNEPFRSPPTYASDGNVTQMVDFYKNHVRNYAPDTMVLHFEPVECNDNWGPFLKDIYAPLAGFSWSSGKDAWAWHGYDGTNSADINATWNYGGTKSIPMMNTEFSYPEDYWQDDTGGKHYFNSARIDGYKLPAEWCERNGMSWSDWVNWSWGDCVAQRRDLLVPDAISKGYAWWSGNATPTPTPTQAPAGNIIPQSRMTATASSYQSGEEASKILDGNNSTIWHTQWNPTQALPQSITLYLGGTTYTVNKLRYLPRQDAYNNGVITGYNVYVSNDGVNFGSPIATGTWAMDHTEKSVSFTGANVKYIRLEATAGNGGWASVAEINVEGN